MTNDEILINKTVTRFTLNKSLQRTSSNPESEYMLYSDRVRLMFPRFVLDDELRFMPAPGTATVNFWQLQDLLLSKDLNRIKELDWID
jgi:hypothetical protein